MITTSSRRTRINKLSRLPCPSFLCFPALLLSRTRKLSRFPSLFSSKPKSTRSSVEFRSIIQPGPGDQRSHVREGDAGGGGGPGAGGGGEEGVLGALLFLWHHHLQGTHLCAQHWKHLPLRGQGRVQECGQTHVMLFEYVTELYSHTIFYYISLL